MGVRRWLRELTASQEELDVLRAIDAAPASAIGELPEDTLGKITGVVHELDGAHLRSPLAQVRCVWWSVKITGGPLAVVRRGGVDFAVADPSGRAVIVPAHARALVSFTHFSKCRGIGRADDRQRPFLEQLDVVDPAPTWLIEKHTGQRTEPYVFRFAEAVIRADDRLAIAGTGIREHDPDASGVDYRTRQTRIRISGTPERPLHLTDEL